jgi:hypothetical protein
MVARVQRNARPTNPFSFAGWVLLIGEQFEQARVICALLVSIAYTALHFCIKPVKECVANYSKAVARLRLLHQPFLCGARANNRCVVHETLTSSLSLFTVP